ncbi:MAG: sarcosine oxidase subunit gamma, partial [Rubellimicrobium sp.]|nr:sarcosine oxidase subunit gamma [Rubellimicrobium sp.]
GPGAARRAPTARTLVGHMTASVTRVAGEAFEIMVMRSMAGTLLHDMTEAARLVAARP